MQKIAFPASLAVAIAAAAFATSGCKSKKTDATKPPPSASAAIAAPPQSQRLQVERVVRDYLNAPSCTDRVPFILNGAKNSTIFLDYYLPVGCRVQLRRMDASDCDQPKHNGCQVKVIMGVPVAGSPGQVNEEEHSYCISFTPTPKIDWRCSKGYNPVSLLEFKAAHDDARAGKFRVYAEQSDVYLDEYKDKQSTWLSVRLRDANGATINAYTEKANRVGTLLSDTLKDGKPHQVSVEIAYSKRNEDREAATLLTLFGFNWREYPGEFE
jgi:hypothetical protein